MRRVQVNEFLQGSSNALLLDVRSPGEYNHAHIPGAISFPLFTDEERKVVGTEYKQASRQAAIKIGLDYFGPKMRGMVEEVERNIEQKNKEQVNAQGKAEVKQPQTSNLKPQIFLYCWRGGMRSGAVGWLLNLYGFDVVVLAGGYKAFRNHVLRSFEQPRSYKIIGGYTGSGKTQLLQHLKTAGEAVVDLEGVASHKGSAFGNINMPPQPTQEMFENLLSHELQALSCEQNQRTIKNDKIKGTTSNLERQTSNLTVWLEDESQRIGTVNIPSALWKAMRSALICFLDIPFAERLKRIVEEYGPCDKNQLAEAIERIKRKLGGLEAKAAKQFLEEGKVEDCFAILLRYYDKLYLKGLNNRENLSSLLTTVALKTVTPQNAGAVLRAQYAV